MDTSTSGAPESGGFEVGRAMGAKPQFFPSPVVDDLLTIVLQLGAELWVVKDRVRLLETALEEAGVSVQDRIENRQPSAEERREVIRRRDAFVEQLYGCIRDRVSTD